MIQKYRILGFALLLIGICFLFFAPFEMYCLYLFSEGGKFYYEGFRFGSFMFGSISSQVVGYLFIGTILSIVGYGHIKLSSWVRQFTISLLYSWLIVGLPVSLIFMFMLLASKDVSVYLTYSTIIVLILLYFVLPFLIIKHYKNNKAVSVFITQKYPNFIESIPIELSTSNIVSIYFIVIDLLLIAFNCVFPLFGSIVIGRMGLYIIEINIALLSIIIIGTTKKKRWALLISIIYYGLLFVSILITFIKNNYFSLLKALNFPEREVEFLKGIPLKSYQIILIVSIPIIFEIINRIFSKDNYK